jgi:hypothetical protein
MRNRVPNARKLRGQEGYALALVVFMLALAVIAVAAVAPDVITNGRREKEEEMIWRGKQYVRGIRLYVRYYQTHGGTTRFPTSMEDLTKNKVGIRFMRQAYKDPVNPVDGSWRMIYVGPNGQLIGSLKSRPLTPDGQNSSFSGSSSFGSSFGGSQSSSGNNSSFGSSSFGSSSFGGSSSGNSSFGNSSFNNGGSANGTNPQGQAAGQGTQGGLSSDTFSTPQAIANSDGTTDVVGGNIIGVGSKVNKASIIWYDKAKNYRQFEFIWDPAKEPINGGAAAVIGVPPAGTQNGSNSLFGNPAGNSGFGQQPAGSPTGSLGGNPNPGTGNNPPPGQTPPGQTPPGQTPQ